MRRTVLALALPSLVSACSLIVPIEGHPFDECEANDDCGEGAVCERESVTGVPGGQCTFDCLRQSCPRGTRCDDEGTFATFTCVAECAAGNDCPRPEAQACYFRRCETRCFRDSDCSGGRVCNLAGDCVPARVGRANGFPCEVDSDCESNFCLRRMCTSLCSANGPDGCPALQGCAGGFVDGTRICLPSCVEQEDCAPFGGAANGVICSVFNNDAFETQVCIPPTCRFDSDCFDGDVCVDFECQPAG